MSRCQVRMWMAAMSRLHETLSRQEAAALKAHKPLLRLLEAAERLEGASPEPGALPNNEEDSPERAPVSKRLRTRR